MIEMISYSLLISSYWTSAICSFQMMQKVLMDSNKKTLIDSLLRRRFRLDDWLTQLGENFLIQCVNTDQQEWITFYSWSAEYMIGDRCC